jgi:hypothetical protein
VDDEDGGSDECDGCETCFPFGCATWPYTIDIVARRANENIAIAIIDTTTTTIGKAARFIYLVILFLGLYEDGFTMS